jgi:hypothetical protein
MQTTTLWTAAAVIAISFASGCSKQDAASGSAARDSAQPSAAGSSTAAAPRTSAAADSIVRGTITSVSDSVLVLSAPTGTVRIAVVQPIKVFTRESGDLSRVTDHSFVGVTSVPQPDGTQRATEIHVFPEELRGLGEGSRPMGPQGTGARSTMTNGSIANSRMTNGAARMTNGTSRGAAAGTVVVEYNGGSQTISVPSGVTVSVIAPTSTKLTPGTSVVVPATRQPDGSLKSSLVLLAGSPQPAR